MKCAAGLITVLAAALTACSSTVAGTATWPGATLDKALLTESDFPSGVLYNRIPEDPGQAGGAGGPAAMLSKPPGCTDGMTKVISGSAERGPGSAAKYGVIYDGARIVMTLLSWHLDLDKLAQTAERCATFEAFFDLKSAGIPMTTTKLPSAHGALIYEQTMTLGSQQRSVYMVFDNIGSMAFFGMATPFDNPAIDAKASLPQTFLEIVGKQAARMSAL